MKGVVRAVEVAGVGVLGSTTSGIDHSPDRRTGLVGDGLALFLDHKEM